MLVVLLPLLLLLVPVLHCSAAGQVVHETLRPLDAEPAAGPGSQGAGITAALFGEARVLQPSAAG
jgi:hypothetical protein